ncbi:MAG TPA: nitrate reductase associated protein [Cyclobacteriaceae bacterium]|nr:nitrate reductase associated protein [Cyclobacteriaceae bacterium]
MQRTFTELQRFALLKLTRPGHENRNFPRAVTEFRERELLQII